MVIECPYCSTRFRVEERRLRGHALLKCSHCTRVFPIPKSENSKAARNRPGGREPENLSFAFEEEDDDWQNQANDDPELPSEQFILNVDPPASAATTSEPGDLFSSEVVPDEHEWVEEDEVDEAGDDYEAEEDGSAASADAEAAERPMATTQLKSVFLFLALVVAGYATLAWTLRTNPAWTASIASSLPIVGDEVAATRLRKSVALVDFRGRYERTKDGKLVFVVTGRAINQADEALANLRIQLALLGDGERRLEQQTTICGNPVRVELIRDLSVDQVAILKGIKPLEGIELQPGESCPLVSIFLDVPPGVATFSAEVISAQRQA